MSDIKNLLNEFNEKFEKVVSEDDLKNLKTEFFGKNGKVSSQFQKMGLLKPDEKKNFAKELNDIKNELIRKLENKFKYFENLAINDKYKD